MGDGHENPSPAQEVSLLPPVVLARSPQPTSPAVLQQGPVPKCQQGGESEALAKPTCQQELLERPDASGTRPGVAQGQPALLEARFSPSLQQQIALQDFIGEHAGVNRMAAHYE